MKMNFVGLLGRRKRKEEGLEASVLRLLENYEEICMEMSRAVRASDLPQKRFYLEMGISRATFDRRLRRNDWRLEELRVLVRMVG